MEAEKAERDGHIAEKQRLEIEKLKAEIDSINNQSAGLRKSLRRTVSEWLLAGGAALGVANLGVSYFDKRNSETTQAHIAACDRATEILSDDRWNEHLAPEQRNTLIDQNLQILTKCSKDAGHE